MTAYVGVGSVVSLSVTAAASATTPWIDQKTQYLRCVAIGASAIHVNSSQFAPTGNSPHSTNATGGLTATAQDFVVTREQPIVIGLNQVCSQTVVAITTGTQTEIDFPEGTGSQFVVGQAVSLYVDNAADGTSQTGFAASVRDVGISTVYTGNGVDGYFATRVGIDTNTQECPAYLGFGTAFAQLRGNFKVAGICAAGSGSGTLLVQQVQVVGG
tara:strand:+ start:495 stop:1136 length:642 start_codon:yes stop_codon:yes gene_type:complete